MPKKSTILDELEDEDYQSSMLIVMREDGERLYFHPFENDLSALEFLEQMTSALRIDIMELALKRSVN